MSRRLLTAWLILVWLVLKAILVPSGSTSSRMSSDPRARIIGDFAEMLGGVAVRGGGVQDRRAVLCQPRSEVAVELGAVGECDRGHYAGEHDREHGEGGEDDA